MPLTRDAEIIEYFAMELSPDIMPKPSDVAAEAIRLANEQLRNAGRQGSIVLLTDGVSAEQNQRLAAQDSAPIQILAIAGDQAKPLPIGSPPAPASTSNH